MDAESEYKKTVGNRQQAVGRRQYALVCRLMFFFCFSFLLCAYCLLPIAPSGVDPSTEAA